MEPTVSIVIPLYLVDDEVLEYARRCIASIKEHTNNYELILIDNGGIKEVDEWRTLADVYVLNQKNLGYGPAINQGFKLAKGKFLCAMNDDVIVNKDWLPPLLRSLVNPEVGVVRAADEREEGSGMTIDHTWYHGFCWVIKRETWQRFKDSNGNILDEQFKIGYFEDLDLWRRMMTKGMKLAKNFDSRVFHHGGLTVHKLDMGDFAKQNEEKFVAKHSMPEWREFFYPRR